MIKKNTLLWSIIEKTFVLIQYYMNLLFLKEVNYPRKKNTNLSSCFSKPITWCWFLVLSGYDPEDKSWDRKFPAWAVVSFLPRFWSGMYNRFEKGLQPRQSVTDYLMAVKEESQQLEEELEALQGVSLTVAYIIFCAC